MKLNLASSSKWHTIFSEEGINEIQLLFELKVLFTDVLKPKTEDGVNVIPLPLELKVLFIHILLPENSK
jgi:hypothetical protein